MKTNLFKNAFLFGAGACIAMVVSACGLHLNCPEPTYVELESGTYTSQAQDDVYTTEGWAGAPQLEQEDLIMELDREAGTVVITNPESEFRLELMQ